MNKPTDVLADLDELIESLRGSADAEYSTDSASPSPNDDMKTLVALTDIRTKFAALVEAARRLPNPKPGFGSAFRDVPVTDLIAVHAALRSAGQ